MSVEQTTQLIQLILNSVMMITACVVVLVGLMVRHVSISDRLQAMNREYFELLNGSSPLKNERLAQLKRQLRQVRQRCRTAQNGVLAVHYALLLFITSTFVLTLRTVVSWGWLIPGSLLLFMLGVGMLLLSMMLTLIDFQASDRSLWEEMKWVLSLSRGGVAELKNSLQLPPSRPTRALPSVSTNQHHSNSNRSNLNRSNIRVG